MKIHFLFYGLLIFALLMLFQFSRFWTFGNDQGKEIFILVVALVSILIGIYFGKNKSLKRKDKSIANSEIDHDKINSLEITSREYEVLELISKGFSNKEIADQLFLSESTIKTHVSKLFVKLDAKRRTQAITIAKDLRIIH